ncbi:MAG: hypothetical protein RLY93_04155 [Sumerlaeia bacterium]
MARRLALAAMVMGLAGSAVADTVVLRNGNRLDGVIRHETDSRVVLQLPSGQVTLSRSAIAKIEREGGAENALKEARHAFARGRFDQALAAIDSARVGGAAPEAMDRAVWESEGAILREARKAGPGPAAQAIEALRDLGELGVTETSGTLALARGLVMLGADGSASELLFTLDPEKVASDPRLSDFSRGALRRSIREFVLAGEYEEALRQIEWLRRIEPEGASRQAAMAHLAAAAAARDRQDYGEALRVLAADLYPLAPATARNRTRVVLRQMVVWAANATAFEQARHWLTRDVIPRMPVEGYAALHELIEIEARLALRQGDAARALELVSAVPEGLRPESLQTLHLRSRFFLRREELEFSDPVGLFELAQEAAGDGLYEEALTLLEDLQKNDSLKDLADEQAELIKSRRDLDLFDQAVAAFEQGLMDETINLCNRMDLDPDRESPIVERARKLAEAARQEKVIERERRPYQAEAFFQMAQRAFFLGRSGEAWQTLDTIVRHFPETPAAKRSLQLLPQVERELALQLVEGYAPAIPSYEGTIGLPGDWGSDELGQEVSGMLEALEPRQEPFAAD